MMLVYVLTVIAACLLGQTDASVRCFECTDMPHPQDCPTVATCSSHEQCYVEQFVTSGGEILYNSGCMSQQRCKNGGKRDVLYGRNYFQNRSPKAKRQNQVSVTDIATCMVCCAGNFCNVEGCGTVAVDRTKRGPKCFSCDAQSNPESCRDTIQCDMYEVCAIYKPLDRLAYDEWKTECLPAMQCRGIVTAEINNMHLGKRADVTVNQCPRCCSDDLCNYSCRQHFTFNQTTAVPTHPTHPPTKIHTHPPTHQTHPPTHPTHHHTQPHTPSSTKPTVKVTTKATPKPTVHHQTPSSTKPTVKVTTKATTKPAVHHQTPSSTKPTVKVTTKATTKPAVHHQTPSSTKPTVKVTTKATTKPPVKHTTPPTTKPTTKPTMKTTIKLTPSTTPLPTTDPAVGCKVDGYIYDPPTKLCLKFYHTPLYNWTEAQDKCNSTKGRLAIITDEQKVKDVLQFYKHFGYTDPMWVGATDFGNGHVFTFTDGSKLTLDPADGQDLSQSNCLYVQNSSYDGFGPCSEKHGFICERKSTIRG